MSHIPYGYRIEVGKAVIDPECAENLHKFYLKYLDGQSIEAAGSHIPLGRTCLGNMLKNLVYLGDSYYPQIIDLELFLAAQEERTKRYEKQGRPSKAVPIDTVPIQTEFHILDIKEQFEDPARQAAYVYERIKEN